MRIANSISSLVSNAATVSKASNPDRSSATAPGSPQLANGQLPEVKDTFEVSAEINVDLGVGNNIGNNVGNVINIFVGGAPGTSKVAQASGGESRSSPLGKIKELFDAAKQGEKFGKEDMQRFQAALKAHAQSLPEGSPERAEFEKAGNQFSQELLSAQGKNNAVGNSIFTHAKADEVWKLFLASFEATKKEDDSGRGGDQQLQLQQQQRRELLRSQREQVAFTP